MLACAEDFLIGTESNGTIAVDSTGTVEHAQAAYGAPGMWFAGHRDGVSGAYYALGSRREVWLQTNANWRPTWSAVGGGSFSYDGADDVLTSQNRGSTGAVSIAFWVNMRLSSGTKTALGDYNETGTNCGIRVDATAANASLYRFRLTAFHNIGNYIITDGAAVAYLTTGRWYHVVATFNGQPSNSWYLYTNGANIANISYTHAGGGFIQLPTQVRDPWSIGATDKSGSPFYQQFFPGSVDDVRVYYGLVLTNTDATAIFNQTRSRYGL